VPAQGGKARVQGFSFSVCGGNADGTAIEIGGEGIRRRLKFGQTPAKRRDLRLLKQNFADNQTLVGEKRLEFGERKLPAGRLEKLGGIGPPGPPRRILVARVEAADPIEHGDDRL
jgi:hypothetical protein